MGKSIKVNYFLNMSYQVLVLLVPIVTTPYIARTLGAEGIGIYSYTYSVVSCFVLAAVMGTTSYAQRTIAYYQKDVYKRQPLFWSTLRKVNNCGMQYPRTTDLNTKKLTFQNPYGKIKLY